MKFKHVWFLSLILLVNHCVAQKNFEGKVLYKVEVTGDNTGMMASMMPQSMEYQIKASQMKMSMQGGMVGDMMGEIIMDNQKQEGYMLQHSSKTAFLIKADSSSSTQDMKPEIRKSGETEKILGYTCKKFTITLETQGMQMTQEIWATDEINVERPTVNNPNGLGQIFVEGIEGFPLKTVMEMPMGMGKMVMTATEVKKETVKSEIFKVPAGYTVKDFDPSALMGGMKY